MTFRASLKNLIIRSPAASLRERAAHLQADLSRVVRQPVPPAAEPTPDFADQVAQAGLDHDVLACGGIDHRDGTVSYADASGKVVRRPMERWIIFSAFQMHSHVQGEIARRRVVEANPLPADEYAEWEARIRRELRADAVFDLAFRSERAFKAAQDLRSGAEPATPALRRRGDAELVALAPAWEAALDLYQQRTDEENQIGEAASNEGWPGAAPEGAGPEWRAWFRQKEDWRERTGVAAAEEASSEAGTALHEIELQIGALPAASLAGLKLKARVAQRSDDMEVTWPEGLGLGLARDILAFTEAQAAPPRITYGIAEQVDFGAATLDELRVLHDKAHALSDVAYSMSCQGCCQSGDRNPFGDHHNRAGHLLHWLGDALTDVESAAADEMQRRRPTSLDDRKAWLASIADRIIFNGDDDETATFVRDLTAWAAEQAGR